LLSLVGAHGDGFELLELSKEVLDHVQPFVRFLVDCERLCAARIRTLAPRTSSSGDNGVAIERIVSDQRVEGQFL
jgi:hypothetical protein